MIYNKLGKARRAGKHVEEEREKREERREEEKKETVEGKEAKEKKDVTEEKEGKGNKDSKEAKEEVKMIYAYICDGAYVVCNSGEYMQPLEGTENKIVKIKGVKVLTAGDNEVGKNLPYRSDEGCFGECKKNGGDKCKLKEKEKIKWLGVNERVKIDGTETLNGGSYAICPYTSEKIVILEHCQSDKKEDKREAFDKKREKSMAAKIASGALTLGKAFIIQLGKELKYMAEFQMADYEIMGENIVNGAKLAVEVSDKLEDMSEDDMRNELKKTGEKLKEIIDIEQLKKSMGEAYEQIKKGKLVEEVEKTTVKSIDELIEKKYGNKVSKEAKEWYRDTICEVVLGEGTDKMTIAGFGLEMVVGEIPVLGQLCDIRDVTISYLKKDKLGMILNGIGCIPIIGGILKFIPRLLEFLAKIMKKLRMVKVSEKLIEAAKFINKQYEKLAEVRDAVLQEAKEIFRELKQRTYGKLMEASKKAICKVLKIGCFKEGTLVRGVEGLRRIEEIEEGEKILSYKEERGEVEERRVLGRKKQRVEELIEIELLSGEKIEATKEHEIYIEGKGYVKAEDLKENDKVLKYTGEIDRVKSIEEKIYIGGIDVYDLEVDENHNYFVGDNSFLVHNNCEKASELEKFMKKIKMLLEQRKKLNKVSKFVESKFAGIVVDVVKDDVKKLKNRKITDKMLDEIKERWKISKKVKTREEVIDKLYGKIKKFEDDYNKKVDKFREHLAKEIEKFYKNQKRKGKIKNIPFTVQAKNYEKINPEVVKKFLEFRRNWNMNKQYKDVINIKKIELKNGTKYTLGNIPAGEYIAKDGKKIKVTMITSGFKKNNWANLTNRRRLNFRSKKIQYYSEHADLTKKNVKPIEEIRVHIDHKNKRAQIYNYEKTTVYGQEFMQLNLKTYGGKNVYEIPILGSKYDTEKELADFYKEFAKSEERALKANPNYKVVFGTTQKEVRTTFSKISTSAHHIVINGIPHYRLTDSKLHAPNILGFRHYGTPSQGRKFKNKYGTVDNMTVQDKNKVVDYIFENCGQVFNK